MAGDVPIKPVFWMGSSRADLKTFPEPVQPDVGYALFAAQRGEEYRSVKSLQGFGGRGVLEVVAPHDGDAYRAVSTVRFRDSIYVLHAFQKKSTRGIATPKREIDLVSAAGGRGAASPGEAESRWRRRAGLTSRRAAATSSLTLACQDQSRNS